MKTLFLLVALKEEKLSATIPEEELDYKALQIGIQLDSMELVLYSGSSNLVRGV